MLAAKTKNWLATLVHCGKKKACGQRTESCQGTQGGREAAAQHVGTTI